MLKITLIAGALALAGATAASAQDYRAQSGGWDEGGGHAPYGYDNSTSALGRYCPPGLYPHSFASSSGIRCEPVGGTTLFIPPY